ncbi:MAG: phytoene/squalene synthase family protein [Terracidiphilus sp.]
MTEELTLDAAYAICRATARREARNFYFAFLALTPARKDAICAVYAFMRKADDLSDDESLSRDERRRQLNEWLAAWRATAQSGVTADPVFFALRDAVTRFGLPLNLLEELVAGTTMDLDCASTDQPDTYATFDDLYKYCYLVASVVGLVCIRIFGYSDPAAEKLAEETGIAFQLTNILRDVAEDAERNRVYIPLEDLSAHKIALDAFLHRASGAPPTAAERSLFAEFADRADKCYKSADALLPLIARESRPALWVLVSIYRSLLRRIQRTNYDVFTRRASVPTAHKLAILVVGLTRAAWARITG